MPDEPLLSTALPKPKRPRPSRKRITPAAPRSKSERAELAELKKTDLTAFSDKAQEIFVNLICRFIAEEGPLAVHQVYQEASYELNVSIETTKRYLFRHTARRAHFYFLADGRVDCRPHESE